MKPQERCEASPESGDSRSCKPKRRSRGATESANVIAADMNSGARAMCRICAVMPSFCGVAGGGSIATAEVPVSSTEGGGGTAALCGSGCCCAYAGLRAPAVACSGAKPALDSSMRCNWSS